MTTRLFGRTLVVVAALAVFGACSSSSKSSPPAASTPTSAAPSATAKIDALVVPTTVQCGHATSTKIAITYAVSGAASQQLLVDGLSEPALTAASGTVHEPVHCDGVQHTVALVATDAQGERANRVENFTTVMSGAGA